MFWSYLHEINLHCQHIKFVELKMKFILWYESNTVMQVHIFNEFINTTSQTDLKFMS